IPASSDRLAVRLLRPRVPAENDPAEPNALTQSLQLICSLTPSSTSPSTRLVVIWLKRCLARSVIDAPLEAEPVGVGEGEVTGVGVDVGVGVGFGVGVDVDVCDGLGEGLGDGRGDGLSDGLGDGLGVEHGPSQLCADEGLVCAGISISENAAVSAADKTRLRVNVAIVSGRTACRWDRRRPAG